MRKIAVYTDDKYLKRKIELELLDEFTITESCADIAISDLDSAAATRGEGTVITLSRELACDVKIPFRIGELKDYILSKSNSSPRLSITDSPRQAVLDGVDIKLTELEFALLSLLISGAGNFVSREEINEKIFHSTDGGMINLYVHYLREKLEACGEKIILSSRKNGYCIDKKYLMGATVC